MMDLTTEIDWTLTDSEKNLKIHRHFLEMAKLVAQQSPDTTKVGAVIVENSTNRVVSTGYNSFPLYVDVTDERIADRDMKLAMTVHAEIRAIINAKGDTCGHRLYVWPTLMKPACCPQCAAAVAEAHISDVYYYENGEDLSERWEKLAKYSRIIFDEGWVDYYAIPMEKVE